MEFSDKIAVFWISAKIVRLSLEREKNTFLLPNSITVHYTVFAIFPYFLRFCRDFAGTLTFLVRSGACQKRQKIEIAEPTWLWQLATIRTSERFFLVRFFTFFSIFCCFSCRSLGGLCGRFWARFARIYIDTYGPKWSPFFSLWALLSGFVAISGRRG